MVFNPLDRLKEQINQLTPTARAELDEYLVDKLSADVETQRPQYQMALASDYLTEAKELMGHWRDFVGISSGYETIDGLTKGFRPGEVTVIAGATSQGKTTLAVNMAANMAVNGLRVLFVTLEMTKPQLTSRLLFVKPEFEGYAANVCYQLADELNWTSVDGLMLSAKRELSVDVVIIDHLHYFTRELHNVAEDIGRITKEFSKNAKRHNLPVLVISHTRKTEKGEGTTINDLRGSSYIGQDADIVLMVNRDPDFPTKMAVTCAKNRNKDDHNEKGKQTVLLDFDATRLHDPVPSAFPGVRLPPEW